MKYAPFAIFLLLFTASQTLAAPISDRQAASHVGETAIVEGVVKNVFTTGGGTTFLDFGASYPDETFTGVIFDDYAGEVGDVSGLTGRKVDIFGKITLYRGKPQIILKSRTQIRVY